MAKIQTQVARKSQGQCSKCGDPIGPGEQYRKVTFYRQKPRVRCMKIECNFRSSETVDNDKISTVYAAIEGVEDSLAEWEKSDETEWDAGILESFGEQVDGALEMWDESIENIVDGFGHETSKSEELQEMRDEVESWKDDAMNVDIPEREEGETMEDWKENVASAVEAVMDCPV